MAQVVFVVPHADDDSLSMGCAIRNHLEARAADGTAAHQVHTLLLTPGSGSAAQPGTGLSDGAFSAARDDEYLRACRSLGVPFHRIHFAENRQVGDTVLTVEEAQDAISALLGELDPADGPVWGKALSNLEAGPLRHPDHVASGQAVANLIAAGELSAMTTRFYVEPYARSAFVSAHPGVPLGSETAKALNIVAKALHEYKDPDSAGSRYGIGYRSVPSYIDAALANPVNYWHVPLS